MSEKRYLLRRPNQHKARVATLAGREGFSLDASDFIATTSAAIDARHFHYLTRFMSHSTPPLPVNASSWTLSSISTQAMLVNTEVRPVAVVTVLNSMVPIVAREWESLAPKGVQWLSVPEGKTHTDIIIFQHKHLKEVARAAYGLPHSAEIVRHWFQGKMFGYSENKIAEFVSRLS